MSGQLTRISIPFVTGLSVFMLALGAGSVIWIPKNGLGAVVLLATGSWLFLSTRQWRRDRHAFATRYVLDEDGIGISTDGSTVTQIGWSQVSDCYQSRLFRYFRIAAPGLEPTVVLTFGAPPKGSHRSGDPKYVATKELLERKIPDRWRQGWLGDASLY
ncbi:MAG: hypothetical protein JSS29_08510 [Proteobacteria bacterium]|nr:hypothetical protein [Pseudomonadota bacterium]